MSTTRWRFAFAIVIALGLGYGAFALSQRANVHAAPKAYRIGVLSQGNPPTNDIPGADFRQGLRDWGYVEGGNVEIDFRYGAGHVEKLPELASELVGMKEDVIVTVGDS